MKYILFILFFSFLLFSNCKTYKINNPGEINKGTISIENNFDDSIYYYEIDTNKYNEKNIDRFGDLDDNDIEYPKSVGNKQKHNNETITITIDSNIIKSITDTDTIIKTKHNSSGIMYHIKYDTMFVGIPKRIKFVISKKILNNIHIKEIFNTITTKITKIKITNNIRVELIDPLETNFKIIYIGKDTKQHLDSLLTIWEWSVTPLTEGHNHLILCVDVFIDGTNQTTRYEDSIIVISNDTIFNKIIRFLETYWQWLIGTFILPFTIFIWKKKKKSKNDNRI